MEQLTFSIEKHFATLSVSTRTSLELNRVSFNNAPAKMDLRRWGTGPDGERLPFKGVQLSDAEVKELKLALNAM